MTHVAQCRCELFVRSEERWGLLPIGEGEWLGEDAAVVDTVVVVLKSSEPHLCQVLLRLLTSPLHRQVCDLHPGSQVGLDRSAIATVVEEHWPVVCLPHQVIQPILHEVCNSAC